MQHIIIETDDFDLFCEILRDLLGGVWPSEEPEEFQETQANPTPPRSTPVGGGSQFIMSIGITVLVEIALESHSLFRSDDYPKKTMVQINDVIAMKYHIAT